MENNTFDIICMLFGILGSVFAITFFLIEYGKWKRKALIISKQQKIIRSLSFLFLLIVLFGIFLFGLFHLCNIINYCLKDLLLTLTFILLLLINLYIDFALTRKRKFFINEK